MYESNYLRLNHNYRWGVAFGLILQKFRFYVQFIRTPHTVVFMQ